MNDAFLSTTLYYYPLLHIFFIYLGPFPSRHQPTRSTGSTLFSRSKNSRRIVWIDPSSSNMTVVARGCLRHFISRRSMSSRLTFPSFAPNTCLFTYVDLSFVYLPIHTFRSLSVSRFFVSFRSAIDQRSNDSKKKKERRYSWSTKSAYRAFRTQRGGGVRLTRQRRFSPRRGKLSQSEKRAR